MSATVILNGNEAYLEEPIWENARLTVQLTAERQHRRELETILTQSKQENETLASQVDNEAKGWQQVSEGLKWEKVLASKLDQAIKDLHTVTAGGDACMVCKSKCLMGTADACHPRWKGLDN